MIRVGTKKQDKRPRRSGRRTKAKATTRSTSREDHGDIADEARDLRHVAEEVRAQLRVLVVLEICEAEDSEGANRRRDKMGEETNDEVVLPEEVEGNHCGADVSRELQGMNLVVEDFFLQSHGDDCT
jgi:hypothetical protein